AEVNTPPPALRISVEKGTAGDTDSSFTGPGKIGRADECEVRRSESKVSRFHAEVRFAQGKWWLIDLKSTNGTYVDGESTDKIALTGSTRVEFGPGGPVLSFSVEAPEGGKKAQPVDLSITQLQKHYFEERPGQSAGAHTMMIRAVYGQLKKKQQRRFALIIGALVCLVLSLGAYAVLKHLESNKQKALAEDIFYAIKSSEIEFADLLRLARQSKDVQALETIKKYQARQSELEGKYNEFLKGLDVYGKSKSEEERLILSIAHTFGECEVAMPDPFIKEVRNYIAKWKSTPRLGRAIELAKKNGYVGKIAETMQANGMPPQFFYLGLVESNFDARACGPPTRFGIAKGMWQFIPTTARNYGLRTGPMVELRQFDPEDERHDFLKSTRAAAEYIRYIYDTQAQASGLLVMASYNWGENRVIRLINTMPENPRERNFWRLLSQYKAKIPQETYDYVFYIVSASVIGENPRLFGFDFDNPLAQYKR
ncbi:MAG: FHA domain-containing protein, partial [Syntrophobacteraceae bacterium]